MVRWRKVALHTSSHLTPTEAWGSPDSTTSEGRRVSSEVRLGNCTQVWGVGQIWREWDSRLMKNSTSHLFWLVQTYPGLRKIQWPWTLVSPCHFLHFRTLLSFNLTSYPGEIEYFNSPNRQLSNGARVMELYWNRNVYPSWSPCLTAIDRKSFERGKFLVLHPILLKIAFFKSANWQLSIDVLPKELRQRKIVDPSRGAPWCSVERNFYVFRQKNWKSWNFLSFGQSYWNCIFKLSTSDA